MITCADFLDEFVFLFPLTLASADAYLTPCIKTYLASFAGGFQNSLEGKRVLFMQSDGGLTPMDK